MTKASALQLQEDEMTDRPTAAEVRAALDEMDDLVRCICAPGFSDRGLHDPQCNCDSAEAVATLRAALSRLDIFAYDMRRLGRRSEALAALILQDARVDLRLRSTGRGAIRLTQEKADD